MRSSLRRQLLAWVLFPLIGAVAVDAWLGFRSAADTASEVQDRLLLGSARMIAEQISFEDGSFQHQIPPAALELFQSEESDRIFYRVTTGSGQLLSGYADLPNPDADASVESPYFFFTVMRDKPVRVAVLYQSVIGNPSALPVSVEVAQTTNAHTRLTNRLWLQAVQQQLLILVLVSVFIMFGLNRGLRPLRELRNMVNARTPGTLQPVVFEGMPTELVPLVDSLNDYIRRLQEHADAQGVFIQNAAHQLRTPLAVLTTQISDTVRATEDHSRSGSLLAARNTLQQAVRLVNQLLMLSAADALQPWSDEDLATHSDLAAITQLALETVAAQAHAKDIDLGFDLKGPAPLVQARTVAVREIVMNLLDNAIRYTPAGGVVTVHVSSVAGKARLVVEDDGYGIPQESWERVFERFYRVDDRNTNGSGLGLAIVREFADKAGARVWLGLPSTGRGLLVTVEFTLCDRP
jgi:two-component system sensor histidine kinase TctE